MTTEQTGLERWQQARREGTDARIQAALGSAQMQVH